ncbi:hypothetical protein DFQ12_3657 [Sphingobacterium detergens]|uniref:Uncharacterized protein n=1 Tax=Sphingobacterium detergens TaxID=1145106 RepID=A0A420AYN1_SPHD1|nr:hypothetical protein DFQ12_3657 [Sphingobacterium detergens]
MRSITTPNKLNMTPDKINDHSNFFADTDPLWELLNREMVSLSTTCFGK